MGVVGAITTFCCTSEYPVYSVNNVEVFFLNPFESSFEVSTLTPIPEVLPYPVRYVLIGFFANYSLVIISKTSENRIKLSN